jgi:hypothetical protein
MQYGYTAGANSERITQSKDSGEEVTYAYDSLQRLVSAQTKGPDGKRVRKIMRPLTMSYEDRIRRGLVRAGIGGDPWVEMLALNLLPDPAHDLSGNRAIWKFTAPRWLVTTIETGVRRKRVHVCNKLNFGTKDVVEIEGRTDNQHWRIPLEKITGVGFKYYDRPNWFYKAGPAAVAASEPAESVTPAERTARAKKAAAPIAKVRGEAAGKQKGRGKL